MCGLCGSFTQKGTVLSKRDRTQRARTLEGLLIANQVRGTDSVGVAAIDYDGEVNIVKAVGSPWKYVSREDATSLLRTPAPLMIGHTRMTSMGNDVRDENAHPFVEGNVVGAHNGIINNFMQLDKTVRVDSQAVFRELDKHPDVYDYVFPRVSGSCALTWWDKRDPEALFLVAHLNPLSAAIIPRINTVFWSSVSDHLEAVLRASYGSGVRWMEIKKDTIYRLDAEDIYAWQESEASFGTNVQWSGHGGQVRVYRPDDDEWEVQSYIRNKNAGTTPKVETPSSLPAAMSQEEEERYENFWNKMMADDLRESENESEDDEERKPNSLHALSQEEYESVSQDRFEVDGIDDLDCGYCEKPLGSGGVWDNGLQLMLCRFCVKWWDEFGHYANGGESDGETSVGQTYPLALA